MSATKMQVAAARVAAFATFPGLILSEVAKSRYISVPKRQSKSVQQSESIQMNKIEFTTALERDGYAEISTRTQPPLHHNAAHSHPFDARGLILSGEMTLQYEGKTQTCGVGDSFNMQAGCEHVETFGPEGATYVVGRRQ